MPIPLASDPVTAAFNIIALALGTADQVGQLIARLTDHQRTLAQAEADLIAADAQLDGPKPAQE